MSVVITQAEQKFIQFLDESRGNGLEYKITGECQDYVNNIYSSTQKEQDLELRLTKNEALFFGNFDRQADADVGESVRNTIKNSDFFNVALKPTYVYIGIIIKAFKTGRVFFACVLRADPNAAATQPQKQKKNQQGQKKNKQNKQKNANQQQEKPKFEKYEDGRATEASVEAVCMSLINNYLETHGKQALQIHQRGYGILSNYHKQAVAAKKSVNRSEVLDIMKPFVRRAVGILDIKDPLLVDESYAQNYFSTTYIGSLFQEPMNCIAISFQYNSTNRFGTIITFCGFDNKMPAPTKWSNAALNQSNLTKPTGGLSFFRKQTLIKIDRVSSFIEKINNFRQEHGAPPLEKCDEVLQHDAYVYVGQFAQKQAPWLKYKPSEEVLKQYSSVMDIKTTVTMNDSEYVDTALETIFTKEDIVLGDFTHVGVHFFDAKLQRAVYIVVLFAKAQQAVAE